MKPAVAAAVIFALGVAPGIAGYEGPPPPNPGPARISVDQAPANKDASPAPKRDLSVAIMLQRLKERWIR
jgi:hypothetical protein